jgi:hypothetical protein
LIENTYALPISEKRDTTLARSQERIKTLAEQVAQLLAEVRLSNHRKSEQLNSPLQRESVQPAIAEGSPKTASTNFAESHSELNNYVTHDGECERAKMRSTQVLLADTITFCNAA